MTSYDLPTEFEINNKIFKIRNKGDYRMVLDLISAIRDPNLDDNDKIVCVLKIFYEDISEMDEQDAQQLVEQAFQFIDGGDTRTTPAPKTKPVMDWEQDFKWIVSPINRVLGTEIRSLPYLHWWTFLSAYYEIGDCFFAQMVNIRNKKNKGKKLEKYEQDFERENSDLIRLKTRTTDEEDEAIKLALGR